MHTESTYRYCTIDIPLNRENVRYLRCQVDRELDRGLALNMACTPWTKTQGQDIYMRSTYAKPALAPLWIYRAAASFIIITSYCPSHHMERDIDNLYSDGEISSQNQVQALDAKFLFVYTFGHTVTLHCTKYNTHLHIEKHNMQYFHHTLPRYSYMHQHANTKRFAYYFWLPVCKSRARCCAISIRNKALTLNLVSLWCRRLASLQYPKRLGSVERLF